ncbi:torsin-1A-interacting protein 1 [Labeo rohita]|uniref:torsin-1A-interacting protein 1 n=1 Tax=Labeo rohita TaxID=84645 RepID=UPI0021E31096|nr:torsin-1A-interacting protein 1 [Labeo rohita]
MLKMQPELSMDPGEPKSLTKEEDDESPVKKQKPEEKTRGINEKGDGLDQRDNTDVEMGENEDVDQEMNSDEEAEQDQESSLTGSSAQPGTEETRPAHVRKENRQKPINSVVTKIPKTENYRPVVKYQDPPSVGAVTVENQPVVSRRSYRSSMNYQNTVTEKHKHPPGFGSWNKCSPTEPQRSYVNPIIKHPITNQTTNHKSAELKILQKPVISKASPASSSKGWTWYICKLLRWSLILIGLLAFGFFGFLAYQKFPHLPQTDVAHPKTMEKFDLELEALRARFPSQHPVFWKRSGKHLKSHLDTVIHTEPVSVILTAGLQAERTLGCLARSLATVYSATHNASILEIEGATKREEDSDRVKLEIDEALIKAFEGDKRAAVMHRFEELPPGSSLIFYRYCDHENAAYKKVFLVFTVMLSVDEIATTNLSEVEDMVYNHIKQKFVISDKSTRFNQMDVDKLSGLWSRISHLILPVAAEEKIERQGCEA